MNNFPGHVKFIKHKMTREKLIDKFTRDLSSTIFPLCGKSPKVIFDIGANVGAYTVYLAEYYKDTAHVYSFEPVDFHIDTLKRITSEIRTTSYQNSAII